MGDLIPFELDDESILAIAFKKGDKYSLAIANTSYEMKTISVRLEHQFYNYSLESRSLVSFTFD